MESVIGGAVLVICAFYYGIEKSRAEKNSLLIIEALYALVLYIGQQIETFRTPLPKIYEEYFNDAGEENEESVIASLGSPENVAATIKRGLAGTDESGEYSENGYSNNLYGNRDYKS